MRPQTTVRQVKKSYCKRMGFDRHKIAFRLAGSVEYIDTGMILREETTVQGLEGRIVAAVMSVEQEVSTGGNEKSFQGNEISVWVEEVGVEEDPKINAVTEVDEKIQEEIRDIRIVKEKVLDSIDEKIRKAVDREIVLDSIDEKIRKA